MNPKQNIHYYSSSQYPNVLTESLCLVKDSVELDEFLTWLSKNVYLGQKENSIICIKFLNIKKIEKKSVNNFFISGGSDTTLNSVSP